jgi:osmotically-inducible protein OsmY
MRTAKAFVLGAGVAYLFDPAEGKGRRKKLADRAARGGRRVARWSGKQVRFGEGKLQGLLASAKRPFTRRSPATDDATVLQRIRSDALRDAAVSTKDVEVEVRDGVATLRGTVADPALVDDLIARVAKTPGVRDVTSMLRTGEQAT